MGRSSRRKRAVALLVIAAVAAAIVAGWYGVRAMVEARIRHEADRRGLEVAYSDLRIGWFEIGLKEVQVTSKDGSGNSARLDLVTVQLDSDLRPSSMRIEGGEIEVRKRPEPSGQGQGGGSMEVDATNLSLTWSEGGRSASARGMSLKRNGDGTTVTVDSAEVTDDGWTVAAEKVEVVKTDAVTIKAGKVTADRRARALASAGTGAPRRAKIPPAPEVPWDLRVELGTVDVRSHGATASEVVLWVDKGPDPTYRISGETLEAFDMSLRDWSAHARWDGTRGAASASAGRARYADSRLSAATVELSEVTVDAEATDRQDGLSATVQMQVSGVEAKASLETDRAGSSSLVLELPEQDCQSLLSALPGDVREVLSGMELKGTAGARAHISLVEGKDPAVDFDMSNRCRVTSVPDLVSVKRFSKPFILTVVGADGSEEGLKTGPGTAPWTPVELVSQYVPLAVMATEDPGFLKHRGFSLQAIENSLAQNLKERRFVRGASTITMQLAKNLWLDREKTASRKLQEAVLTTYLEQALSKDRIMELYLNVVEFAPGVYGLKAGAKHWFGADPNELTLSQALVLALQLPRPRHAPFGADGNLTPSRLKLVRTVIRGMHGAKFISADEMERSLKEVPQFRRPRPAVEGETQTDEVDVSGWD